MTSPLQGAANQGLAVQSGNSLTIDLASEAQTANLTSSNSTFGEYLSSIFSGIMTIAVLMVLLYLIWGAIEWITAGGDQSKIQKGRDKIVQSIIGIIVLASSVAIFYVVQGFIGVNILQGGLSTTSGTPASGSNTKYLQAPGTTGTGTTQPGGNNLLQRLGE